MVEDHLDGFLVYRVAHAMHLLALGRRGLCWDALEIRGAGTRPARALLWLGVISDPGGAQGYEA